MYRLNTCSKCNLQNLLLLFCGFTQTNKQKYAINYFHFRKYNSKTISIWNNHNTSPKPKLYLSPFLSPRISSCNDEMLLVSAYRGTHEIQLEYYCVNTITVTIIVMISVIRW